MKGRGKREIHHMASNLGTTPTRAESEAKVRNFAEEIAKLTNETVAPDASPQEALEQAEQWCQELANASREELERKLNEQRNKVIALKNLLQTIHQIDKSQTEDQKYIEQLRGELVGVCKGQTLAELEAQLGTVNKQMREKNAKLATPQQEAIIKELDDLQAPDFLCRF